MIELGISSTEFRKNFFESQPFLKRSACLTTNITWDDVNPAIYISESTPLGIKVHKNGFVPEEQYTERCIEIGVVKRKIIKGALYQLLREGATIIFNRMDSLVLPIRNICNEISRFLQETVVANGYIAFGEKESFGVHWDTHDVFAIQLIGRKRWKIFEPTFHLPLVNQTSKLYKNNCPINPVIDVVLDAGDILYIPRGWWHTAVPLNEETFHIAVGSHQLTVVDYIRWITDQILPDIFECRKSLELSKIENDVTLEASEKIFQAIIDESNYKKFQKQNFLNERMATGFDISRCMSNSSSKLLENTTISFCSKQLMSEFSSPFSINGIEIYLDDGAISILNIIAQNISPIMFENIVHRLPFINAESIATKIVFLASKDVVQIHTQ